MRTGAGGCRGSEKGDGESATLGDMWYEPAAKVLGREPVGLGAAFAGGQRPGPENLHRAKIWYVGNKETACKGYLPS